MDIDDIELLNALREAVHDPNLGPELAGGLAPLLATGGNSMAAANAAAGSLQAVAGWHRQRQEESAS
ncbi:hypothetical protein [Ectothiorhodospira mobilis]|uniref:hypothetical protein n=1 Tax=Ectothiorhodospira mobilis TaxID=195064 RepID=UPI00190476F6|nr:hypothetical protein [Ectothiorhodospira mobilis]MBK1691110.1 hypothetical protein [Ectothiorhodospira mobilis]